MTVKEGGKMTRKEAGRRKWDSAHRGGSAVQRDTVPQCGGALAATSAPSDAASRPDRPQSPAALAAVQETVYAVLGHGAYQRRFLHCCILGAIAVLMELLAFRLIGRRVDHWCGQPEELAHLSADEWKNMSIPVDADGHFSRCTVYDPPVPDDRERTVVPCDKWNYDIKDWHDSVVSRFDLVCGRAYLVDLTSVLPSLVYALLSPVAGFASDRIGRKPVNWACGCLLFFSAVGSSVAMNYAFFLINRLLLIASGSAAYLTMFILLYEVTGQEQRWLYTLFNTAVAGALVPPFMHLLAHVEPSWMTSHAVLILPIGIYWAWCFLLDESPAWLLATWRVREAEVAVLSAARLNDMSKEKAIKGLQHLLAELTRLKPAEGSVITVSAAEGILETVKLRRRAVAAFISRFTASGIYFGLTISDKASGNIWQLVHVVLTSACYAFVIRVTNKWGVRDALSMLLAATCAFTLVKAMTVYGGLDLAAACVHAVMKVVVSCTMSVVMCYAGDTFPTRIRSAGVSLSVFASGIGSMVGISISKVRIVRQHFFFEAFYTMMTLLSIAVVQWLPEVFIKKYESEVQPLDIRNAEERKLAMQASLSTLETKRSRTAHHVKENMGVAP
ncbi:organic cation transporter protein-like [Dermacentor variabilis]|uniref:organic cation transporter protein-like n=1 Tax=Dermacentor variabilis TaxID=34621 RepID=UPI003F5C3C4D